MRTLFLFVVSATLAGILTGQAHAQRGGGGGAGGGAGGGRQAEANQADCPPLQGVQGMQGMRGVQGNQAGDMAGLAQTMLQNFDANGDGALNALELQQALTALRSMMQQQTMMQRQQAAMASGMGNSTGTGNPATSRRRNGPGASEMRGAEKR